MRTAALDIRDAVSAFLAEGKDLVGIGEWQRHADGADGEWRFKRALKWRGEISGEICVIAYPRKVPLCFRIVLSYTKALCRMDYVEFETHTNSLDRPADIPLGPFTGSHYHAWRDNIRFATKLALPTYLHNARMMPDRTRGFENCYRWFCGENCISLAGEDVPELPRRDTLL